MKLLAFYQSTIGKKIVVAVTGILMLLFVVSHMAGNLKIFGGYDAAGIHKIDHYALYLRSIAKDLLGEAGFLWLARLGLIFAVVMHVVTVVQLSIRNKISKESDYECRNYQASSFAARTMLYGGILLLAFIVFHILHFTTGTLHFAGFVHGKVYRNVYNAFSSLPMVLLYIFAMSALALHLYHGTWSALQTLGLDNPDRNKAIRCCTKVIVLLVFFGFISVPLAIFIGILPVPF